MKKLLLSLLIGSILSAASANNIAVTSSFLGGQNTGNHTVEINFDVTWENSWRTSTNESNYDGAWIFVKFRKNGTSAWNHCHIATLQAASNATLTATTDSMGTFIYRSSDFIGNVNYTGNKLIWNYNRDGVLDGDSVEIKVFALEMVYIPTGSYYLGSGGNEDYCFKEGNTNNPFFVSSAGAISTGTSGSVLNFNGLGTATGNQIPATFPNAYNAYWIMKYECSQQQYADFLNLLTAQQASALAFSGTVIFGTSTYPNYIPLAPEQGNRYTNSGENCSFADWAGLRPMSEMEFEKTCRGANIMPMANEYAWGNQNFTNLTSVNSPLSNSESVNLPSNANALIGGTINRPVRVGIFARTAASTRELSGATYYGVMNMSDNVFEQVIYAGNNQGQSISAITHGNGILDASGNTDEPSWVDLAFGLRGSFFDGNTLRARVSDRNIASFSSNGFSDQKGIRLVRTAP